MQNNRLASFIRQLNKCYIYPEATPLTEIVDFLFEQIITFVPPEIYETHRDWRTERNNDNRMSSDMINSVLQDIKIPLKWRNTCKKIKPQDFSFHFMQIIDEIEIDKIDEIFKDKIKSPKFIHDKYERERIKKINDKDEVKCIFLSALFINAVMNSLGKPGSQASYDIDLIYTSNKQKSNRHELQNKFSSLLTTPIEEQGYLNQGDLTHSYAKIIDELTPEDVRILIYFLDNPYIFSLLTSATFDKEILISKEIGHYSNFSQNWSCPAEKKSKNKFIGLEHNLQNLFRLGIVVKENKDILDEEIEKYVTIRKNRLIPKFNSNTKLTVKEKQELFIFGYDISCSRSFSNHINNLNYLLSQNKDCHIETFFLNMQIFGLTWFGRDFLEYVSKDKIKHQRIMI